MADRLKILYRIPELLERYRRGLAIASTLRVVWFLASTHLLVLGVLGWFSLRYPLTPGFLQVMSGSFLIYFGLPILFWIIYQNKNHSPLFIAEKLDHANSKAPDPFRTSLSLSNHGEDTLRKLDRLYGSILSTLQFPRPKFITKSNLVALGLSSVLLGAASIFSHHPVEFFRRVAMPWFVLKTLPLLKFDLDAPRVVLGEGDTAAVVGQVLNALPGQSVFAYVSIGASQSRIPLSIAEEGHFKFNFGPVTRNFSVRFAGENGHSPSFRFTVLPSPYLIGMQAILEPPSYSHLHKDTLPQGVSRFSILPGTRVTWTLKADRPLRSLQFLHSEEESDSKTKTSFISDSLGAGTQYLAVREILHPLNYRFLLEDENGIHSQPMLPNRIDLLSDRPPEVDLITPNSDTVFDRDAKLTLGFRVKDDFGISKLKLVYRILVDGKLQAQGQRDCGDWLKRTHAGLVDTVWNMAGLPLGAQSKVEFYLLAFDNDRVNGPKSGKSETRTLRMLSLHEVVAAARLRELSTESNLKQALEREKQLAKKLERDAQSTHDEGPPMLAEYEVNRIMVEDPQDHLRRTEAALGSLEQTVERQVSEHSQTSTKEMAKVKSGVKEFHEALKKSEPDMPKGNQGFLPMDQRQKNLENLLRSQKDQARRLDALREKMDKITKQSNPFDCCGATLTGR